LNLLHQNPNPKGLRRIGRLSAQFGIAFALAMAGAGGLLYYLARTEIAQEVQGRCCANRRGSCRRVSS
jgi:hypothetical protein